MITLSRLRLDRSAASYGNYLRPFLSQLQAVAALADIGIAELPGLVGGRELTLASLP